MLNGNQYHFFHSWVMRGKPTLTFSTILWAMLTEANDTVETADLRSTGSGKLCSQGSTIYSWCQMVYWEANCYLLMLISN